MTDLYYHYDKDDVLLHVGISLSAIERLKQKTSICIMKRIRLHRRNTNGYTQI
jgi:hypothetical protein